ncbi:MAG TPA: pyridoxal-dependent decarboxylase [Vicinamibacterales bacterium]|nr:pyridoxal-dependent decarboxylase [Vicinamibacterales bacterium]
MIDRLRSLEVIARRLEPGPVERAAMLGPVVDYANAFLDSLPKRPVFVPTDDRGRGIYDAPIGEEPASIDTLLSLLAEHVDRPGINPASQGHLGYIPGGGIVHAAFGDFLADITNKYAGVFFAAPGAVRMENMLLDWMASLVGYPATAVGNLTSGGSIANLVGIVTARDAQGIAARDVDRSVVYLTTHVHHSVDKALRIAGLGAAVVRHVPMDARYRMDADALDAMVTADLRAGLRPWLVIASAGTTDVGAIDPMHAIADIAARHGLWFHLDGAYGAFFALCDDGRRRLDGMGRSDSLIMDPHKGLFLPYGSGAVLVKNRQAMIDSHYYVANYMQDTAAVRDELSPADLSPELSKHFRGLRLWMPLKLCGLAPFRAALEEKLLLARYFYDRLEDVPGFEIGPEPDLSVVTFRYVPTRGDADEFNARLIQEIQNDGRIFLSSSMIDGRFILRLAVLVFRTHLDTIDLAVEVLKEKAARVADQ